MDDIKNVVDFLRTRGVPIKDGATEWQIKFDSGEEFDLLVLFALYGSEKYSEAYGEAAKAVDR